ncbi:MAG TPA: discoidin domain-containing protein [Nitrososphaeraceae archaeon]|nr:discoidin domain-containing protein [Nitrososphaeraceae archaeon]
MKRFSQFKLTKGLILLFVVITVILLFYAFPVYYYDALHVQAQLSQLQQPSQQQQKSPPPIIGIKITSPNTGQQVPVGQLTISGTSTDNIATDCTVYSDWNNTKPSQKAIATGSGGVNDYSTWKYTYTNNYHLITNGTNNLTAKLSCLNNSNGTANLTKYYSVNVIGVNFEDNRMNVNANYTIPPIVKVPSQPIIVEAKTQSGSLVNYNASATDNTGMSIVPVCDPPPGSVFSLGNTTVKCRAVDNDGNAAVASFTVIVHKPTSTTTIFTITETGTYSEPTNLPAVAANDVNSCNQNLAISNNAVGASGSEVENPPSNVVDDNLDTRWSNLGIGSWIEIDLGAQKTICNVEIAWYNGNERQYNFVISVSNDGRTFSNVYEGTSSGKSTSSERYTFSELSTTRYLKITVNGNTDVDSDEKNWAAITEIDLNGYEVRSTEIKPSSPSIIMLNISGVYEQSSVSSGVGGPKIDPSKIEGTLAIINSTTNKKINEFDLAPINIAVTQLSKKITIMTQLDDPITSGTVNATLKFKSPIDFKNGGSYSSTATGANILISAVDGKTYDTKGTAEGKITIRTP